MNNITNFPPELYQTIFQYLPVTDIVRTQRTSQDWSREVESEPRVKSMHRMKAFFHDWFKADREKECANPAQFIKTRSVIVPWSDEGATQIFSTPNQLLDLANTVVCGGEIAVEASPLQDRELELNRLNTSPEKLGKSQFKIYYRYRRNKNAPVSQPWVFSALQAAAVGINVLGSACVFPLKAPLSMLSFTSKAVAFLSEQIFPPAINQKIEGTKTAIVYATNRLSQEYITNPVHTTRDFLKHPILKYAMQLIQNGKGALEGWNLEIIDIEHKDEGRYIPALDCVKSSIRALSGHFLSVLEKN